MPYKRPSAFVLASKLALVLLPLLLTGCSDMKFVNAQDDLNEDDPKENIVLTNVVADFTSGGLMERRIVGAQGSYSANTGLMNLSDLTVDAFQADGHKTAQTFAKSGQVYENDLPAKGRKKGDMIFDGSVQHRTPKLDDPSTFTLILETERLLWDEAIKKFKGDSTFTLINIPPGKNATVMLGDAFETNQDMRSWDVKHGVLGTLSTTGPREIAYAKRDQLMQDELFVRTKPPPSNPDASKPMALPTELQGEPDLLPIPPPETTRSIFLKEGTPIAPVPAGGEEPTRGRKLAKIPQSQH